jgi:hypothetical protein
MQKTEAALKRIFEAAKLSKETWEVGKFGLTAFAKLTSAIATTHIAGLLSG